MFMMHDFLVIVSEVFNLQQFIMYVTFYVCFW